MKSTCLFPIAAVLLFFFLTCSLFPATQSPAAEGESLSASEAETIPAPTPSEATPVESAGVPDVPARVEGVETGGSFPAAPPGPTVAELDTTFETLEEVQTGGTSGEGLLQPEISGDAGAATDSAVSSQQGPAMAEDLEEEAQKPGATTTDDIILNQQYERQGAPTGLEPEEVLAIFSNDASGGEISYPSHIIYDRVMDETYVLHSGPTITIFNSEYFPVASLGAGRGAENPLGFCVDATGKIYISNDTSEIETSRQRPRISVFNAAFFKERDMYLDEIAGARDFHPGHITLGPDNDTLYIANNFGPGVLVIDLEGNFKRWLVPMKAGGVIEEIGNDPGHPDALKVVEVAVDSNGRIYILAPFDGRIYVLDRNENLLFVFGKMGGSTGKLSNPRNIAIDVQRQAIFIVDYMRHAINIYDYNGVFLLEFGGMGMSSGWFNFPNDIAIDRQGNVMVTDMFNHRVQIFKVP
jgi:sugar lactone lactonase YvrE